MNLRKVVAAALLTMPLLVGAATGQAAIVFSDNFDSENGGVGVLNYAGFANWTVSAGTVDLIGNGFFDFYPGNGLYVDLDGSTGNAGVLTSTALTLAPGTYTLQFVLAGSTRGDTNIVDVSLGALYSETFTRASSDPFAVVTRTIVVGAPTIASLAFSNAGGDNLGAILDNVVLSTRDLPEPGTLALLGLGLLGAGLSRLRRR